MIYLNDFLRISISAKIFFMAVNSNLMEFECIILIIASSFDGWLILAHTNLIDGNSR